jgi:RNA polymerase sigma-70 factor (ECF subfamily)
MNDERILIRKSRSGDQRSFELLVRLKREKAFRIAFNIVGDEDDAKDIAQQAFIRLWSALPRFDERLPFDPWFYRIVVNLAIDFYRSEQRRARAALGPPERFEGSRTDLGPGADARVMQRELRRIFNQLAEALAPVQRAVFTLKEIEDVATEDIAKIMDIKASTVRNHLMQARRLLQEGLRRHYPEYFRGTSR